MDTNMDAAAAIQLNPKPPSSSTMPAVLPLVMSQTTSATGTVSDPEAAERELLMLESDLPDDDIDEENDASKADSMENFHGSSGRTVTLPMLLAAKMLEPGKSTMTIEYLGQKFVGDLLADGKIKSQETETIFCSPSAWAMHCKRIINPEKKSGCGWASVKYKGKKLDAYKAQWLRKCAAQKEETTLSDDESDRPIKELSPEPTILRLVMPHNHISNRNIIHDTNTLVETVSFAALNKIQPFLVSITTSSVLLMDFHCHLTKTEVCGYLGGSWDLNTHTLAITHAFPCRNSKHDRLEAADVELNIQRNMLKHNLSLVGWYHSHPKCAAQPTLRDCDAQLDYQMKMRGASDATYSPCVGLICSPYNLENPTFESTIMSFWVVPPPENRILEYGRPMLMSYSVQQDAELSAEVHAEMDACIDYYKRFPVDMVDFRANYTHDTPYIEKLKVTLYSKFPQHQDDHQFWNWLRVRLGLSAESEFTPPKWPAVRTTAPPPQHQLQTADQAQQQPQQHMLLESGGLLNGGGSTAAAAAVAAANAAIPHLDLTLDSDQTPPSCGSVGSLSSNEQQTKDAVDKLLVRSLQEQLSLPSGLNMNPSPISSLPLLQPATTGAGSTAGTTATASTSSAGAINAASMSSNNSVQTTSSSPRDSPITIPSNSASPAKFEVPVRASPSPAKSDTTTSSSRTRNSPAPSPNRYHHQAAAANVNAIHSGSGGGSHAMLGGGGGGMGHVMDMLPRSSPSLSVSSVSSQYGGSGKYDSQMSQQHGASSSTAAAAAAAVVAAQSNAEAAAAVAAQQQAQQISDYYSAANYASLTKNLSAFSPRDYAMLFQSKDYGLASLNQLASLSGLGAGGGGASGSGNSNSGSSGKQQQQSGAGSSGASSQNVAVAAAMAGNMKDFLAQLEKSTELSYLMQTANYNYPQSTQQQQQQQSSSQPMSVSSASGGGGGGSSSSRSSKSKRDKEARAAAAAAAAAQQQQQQQMIAQQQQRQMEEEYKKDANKINEFMRSQEYATLLMEQAEAFGVAGGYGAALREPAAPPAPAPPPAKKSRKSQQQHHHQQQNQSAAAAAAAAAATAAALGDLTSLLQGSPKLHELSALFQTGKPGDLQALLQQQFAAPVSSSSLSMPTSSMSSSSSSSKKQQQQQQQQHQQQQQQLQQMQQLQDYNALFSHTKLGDLQSLMSSGMLAGLPPHSSGSLGSSSSSAAAAAAAVSSLLGVGGVHSMHGGAGGSAADLSALFSNALAGAGGGGVGSGGSGLLGGDSSALSASVDMLGSLLQQQQSGSDAAKSAASDLSALFMSSQANAGLHSLFASQPATSSASATSKAAAAAAAAAAASSYYSQAALDKAQLDMTALYQQHSQYAPASSSKPSSSQSSMASLPTSMATSSSGSSAIPDPLSKSTLASNNASMFMNPNALYASMKMQQDALNAAMCMKPPQVSSSPSLSLSGSVASPSNAVPAASKSGRGDRELTASPHQKSGSGSGSGSNKYNFSAVDLAVSSVPPVAVPMSMDHLSGGGGSSDAPKKRMEFSSIADLVAPPSKMKKLEEVAHGGGGGDHQHFHGHHVTPQMDEDGSSGGGNGSTSAAGSSASAVLNLSSND